MSARTSPEVALVELLNSELDPARPDVDRKARCREITGLDWRGMKTTRAAILIEKLRAPLEGLVDKGEAA